MATPESEGRTLIDTQVLATKGQDFGDLFSALMDEYNGVLRARRTPLMQAAIDAFKAANEKGEGPNEAQLGELLKGVNEKLSRPDQYALAVPDGAAEREALLGLLMEMLAKRLRAGSAPAGDAEIAGIRRSLTMVMPAPESPEFPRMLRCRVDVQHGLVNGGFVDAMAVLVRTLSTTRDPKEAVTAAENIAQTTPNRKGGNSILAEVSPDTYLDLMGRRVSRLETRTKIPKLADENTALFEKVYVVFGDEFKAELDAVFVAFGKKVTTFAAFVAGQDNRKDPTYLRLQWYHAMTSNILAALSPDKEKETRAALAKLANNLSTATSINNFLITISTIGKEKVG
jgi:hypothetical protein